MREPGYADADITAHEGGAPGLAARAKKRCHPSPTPFSYSASASFFFSARTRERGRIALLRGLLDRSGGRAAGRLRRRCLGGAVACVLLQTWLGVVAAAPGRPSLRFAGRLQMISG